MENNSGLLEVLIGLIIISACLFGFYLLMKKWSTLAGKNRHSKYAKVIDHLVISRDKYIQFVEIGDDILVLGISSSSMEVLHQIKKENLSEIEEIVKFDTFKDTFGKFVEKRKRKSGDWDENKEDKD